MARDKAWFVTDKGFDWLRLTRGAFSGKKATKQSRNLRNLLRAVASFAGSSRKATLENSRNKAEEHMTENEAFSAWAEARRRKLIQGV